MLLENVFVKKVNIITYILRNASLVLCPVNNANNKINPCFQSLKSFACPAQLIPIVSKIQKITVDVLTDLLKCILLKNYVAQSDVDLVT